MLISNRTSRVLGAGALVLAVSSLAACSTEMTTDEIYTPAAGVNARDARVDVLNAVIVATAPHKGTLITTLVNNEVNGTDPQVDNADQLVRVGGDVQATLAGPVIIDAGSKTVLAATNDHILDAQPGIPVSGEFELGDYVTVVFRFAKAGEVTLEVPVVANVEGSPFSGQDGEPSPAPAQAEESESGGEH
jgi:copper(I)-binding protein